MTEEFKQEILTSLRNRKYHDITIASYSSQLFNLFNYYSSTKPIDITNKQVTKYAKSLIAKKYSASYIRALFYACKFYFDETNNKKHGIYNVKIPPERNKDVEFFSQSEVILMIDTKSNLKHKSIILLLYSCGLETGELLNIKVEHIRSKEKRPNIHITDNSGKIKRKAFLSNQTLQTLRDYYLSYEPESWLFYSSSDKNKKYSATSVRKIISDTVSDLKLNPLLKTKSLRYSYIKHLTDLGVPLIKVLENMGINGFDTHQKYLKLIYGDFEIGFSPIDKKINEDLVIEDFKDLEELVFKIVDKNETDYLIEGIDCFRIGALRAGVIFIWSAVIWNIRNTILDTKKLTIINAELSEIDKRAKKIKNISSFEFVKDETTIHLSERLGIFSKFEKNELINSCLALRNKCGHPSNYKPNTQKVKAFVEDVMTIIYKKHLPNNT